MITHRLLKRLARSYQFFLQQLCKSDYRWCGDLRMDFIKNHSSVRMRDPSEVRRKLDKFICDQPEHLLVIADFDHTLSRTKNHLGEECCISYGVFEMEAMRISPEYGEYFTKLAEKYLPIELSTTMTREEKAPYMVEWWQKSNDHILKAKFTENDIESLVAKSSIDLRDNVDLMIDELDRHNIPLMIFSAGVGNIIDICLQRKMGVVPRNVHIVSNMMLFDERGVSCGFSEPLIHTFCKDGSAIEKCHSLCKETTGRYNVLLLGDSLGDLHMADGYRPNGDNVTILKIGFLNRAFDTHYEKFLEGFDIVLVDDQTVDLPIHLIEKVTCHNAFIKN